jgi:hypothetical protein
LLEELEVRAIFVACEALDEMKIPARAMFLRLAKV